jgi:hypothetical protein
MIQEFVKCMVALGTDISRFFCDLLLMDALEMKNIQLMSVFVQEYHFLTFQFDAICFINVLTRFLINDFGHFVCGGGGGREIDKNVQHNPHYFKCGVCWKSFSQCHKDGV